MEEPPHFVIGHHDPKRPMPVTVETVQDIHAANYDMLTCPITSPHFQSRVLTLLSTAISQQPAFSGEDITKTKNASPVVVSPLNPPDTPLTPDDSISQVIGITSSWTDISSPDPIIADVSQQVLRLEIAYAAFCGITYALIPGPRLRGYGASDSGLAQYARAVMDALSQAPYMQLYIWLPMIDNSEEQADDMGDLGPFTRQQFLDAEETDDSRRLDLFGTWEAWDVIRSICKYHARLGVALSLPKLLPPVSIQTRWYSEPVRLLTLDGKIFANNAKGYPVLSRAHQALISRFIRLRTSPWFLLCDVGSVPGSNPNGMNAIETTSSTAFPSLAQAAENPHLKDPTPHLSYMRNLQTKQTPLTPLDRFGAGYQDYLQAPLQPLTVNLESITYEVFEKDPIKYAWYERAIARALHDWIEQGKPTSNPDGRVVVAVVGAGRGPLVTRALKASEDVGVEIDMWALEKNPNAFVLLQRHNEKTWNNRVKLVKSDMRTWRGPLRPPNAKPPTSRIYNIEQDISEEELRPTSEKDDDNNNNPKSADITTFTGSRSLDSTYLLATSQAASTQPTPYKIDILVSELLGSFADNELSPECLDGVQHLMNPIHGISIPASYTAHLTPISAPKLYADITHGMTSTTPNAAEIPYVVMLNAIDYLSTKGSGNADEKGHDTGAAMPPLSPTSPTSPTSAPYSKAHTLTGGIGSPPISVPQTAALPAPPTPIVGTTWSFQHPNPLLPSASTTDSTGLLPNASSEPAALSNAHNARSSILTFPIPYRGTCHGLGGYFETVLYKGVELSTNPITMDAKSEGMISWFPIYFPLKTPLTLPDASELRVTMWRKTDDRRVWYEWIVDVFVSAPLTANNANSNSNSSKPKGKELKTVAVKAKKIRVGGSELHSSEKDACLM